MIKRQKVSLEKSTQSTRPFDSPVVGEIRRRQSRLDTFGLHYYVHSLPSSSNRDENHNRLSWSCSGYPGVTRTPTFLLTNSNPLITLRTSAFRVHLHLLLNTMVPHARNVLFLLATAAWTPTTLALRYVRGVHHHHLQLVSCIPCCTASNGTKHS
jgi:hypothetical protein